MKRGSICDELDDIVRSYDYGIVPGSATVFVKDELDNSGKLDLTLLEGVMIVVEANEEGFKVTSCTPVNSVGREFLNAQTIQKHFEVPFETMDNLLMAISPMFSQRFQQALYEKLESVHRFSNPNPSDSSISPATTITTTTSIPPITSVALNSPSTSSSTTPNSSFTSTINIARNNTTATTNHLPSLSITKENPSVALVSSDSQPATNPTESINLDQVLAQDVLDDIHNWLR